MSTSESLQEYVRDIESIGTSFVSPLDSEKRGWVSILSGAVLPLVLSALGWLFITFLWQQFILSLVPSVEYNTDPALLAMVFGVFTFMTHFWFVLTGTIVQEISNGFTAAQKEVSAQLIAAGTPRSAIEGITIEILAPSSQRYDRPIGRWH